MKTALTALAALILAGTLAGRAAADHPPIDRLFEKARTAAGYSKIIREYLAENYALFNDYPQHFQQLNVASIEARQSSQLARQFLAEVVNGQQPLSARRAMIIEQARMAENAADALERHCRSLKRQADRDDNEQMEQIGRGLRRWADTIEDMSRKIRREL
ncbi:MAG: hypothetical protein GTO62_03675, partial [Planctomycetales bacterium]|nr:hypothetical protein [Planctomycetales bacterium]NIP84527.1 hypothetical protein [Planctomycetales bacterium]